MHIINDVYVDNITIKKEGSSYNTDRLKCTSVVNNYSAIHIF